LSNQLPYPLPPGYSPSGLYNNPTGTNPFPAPSGLPYQHWDGSRNTVNWVVPTNPLDTAYTRVAYWQTPLFDLRPEIRGSDGSSQTGVPIWSASGKKLWVQVSGLLSVNAGVYVTDTLNVVSREFGQIFDPRQVERITPESDITQDVAANGTAQPPSVVLIFTPPGSGTPVRYWRIEIAFRRTDTLTYPLVVSGAFY